MNHENSQIIEKSQDNKKCQLLQCQLLEQTFCFKNQYVIRYAGNKNQIQIPMPKKIVKLCKVPEYKLTVSMKSLIWYREPITSACSARLSLFGITIDLGFGNQMSHSDNKFHQVEYQIVDEIALNKQLQSRPQPIFIEIIEGSKCVGFCELDPRNITEKSIIAPIKSTSKEKVKGCSNYNHRHNLKLGDIELQFKLTKSVTNVLELRKLDEQLTYLADRNPQELDMIYCKLRRQGYQL